MGFPNVFGQVFPDAATLYCPVIVGTVADPVTGIAKPVEDIVECKAYLREVKKPPRNDIYRGEPNDSEAREYIGYWCEPMPNNMTTNTIKGIVCGRKEKIILQKTSFSAGIYTFKLQGLTGQPIRATLEYWEW